MKLQGWLCQTFWTDGNEGQPNANPRKEDWIGQDRYSEEINKHGGVPEPRGREPIVGPLPRSGSSESRRDWSPRLGQPFVPETREPTAAKRLVCGSPRE